MVKCVFGFSMLWLILAANLALADASVEIQAKALEKEIMAPCCWVAPISDHHSEIAYQLRKRLRVMLEDGQSAAAIKEALVAEYGERILAKPRGQGFNSLVWLMPPILLLVVLLLVFRYLQARVKHGPTVSSISRNKGSVSPEDLSARRQAVEKELQSIPDIG